MLIELENLIAEATLVALGSVVGARSRLTSGRYMLLPSVDLLTRESMVERLRVLPKPVSCIGVGAFDSITVGCWPVTEAEDQEFQRMELESARTHLSKRRELFGGPDAVVVVRGVGADGRPAEVHLPMHALERWWASYIFLNANHSLCDPDEAARWAGAAAVMYFSPHDDSEVIVHGIEPAE